MKIVVKFSAHQNETPQFFRPTARTALRDGVSPHIQLTVKLVTVW
jgi:hypothetical protein